MAESLAPAGQSEAYMASADFDGALLARSVAHGTTQFAALLLGRYLVVTSSVAKLDSQNRVAK